METLEPADIDSIADYMTRLYPGKYGDDELLDIVRRVSGWPVRDVIRAIDEHRNVSRFKPTPAELLQRLKSMRAASAGPPIERKECRSFADILRRNFADLAGASDAFAIWCWARNCWRACVARRHGGDSIDAIAVRWRSELRQVLVAHGYNADESERVAGWIDADDVREVVDSLDGMRQEVAA